MNRYQVYLNPQSVATIDEVAKISSLTRSRVIQEAVDAVANRFGNLLATIVPSKSSRYEWLDELVGSARVKGKKKVSLSTEVDDIYYR